MMMTTREWATATALCAAMVTAACGSESVVDEPVAAGREAMAAAPTGDEIVLTAAQVEAGGITVAPVVTVRRAAVIYLPAVLDLDEGRTARVGAVVDGIVLDTVAAVGVRVARGAVLAELRSHLLHDAWAEYRRALAEERRSEAELSYQVDAEARLVRLHAAKAASPQEVERARIDRMSAEQSRVIARSEIMRTEEELRHLGLDPARDVESPRDAVPVATPLAGTVLERLVSAGTAVTAGTPLYVVSDLTRLWAIAEVDESRLSLLRTGQDVRLSVAAYPEATFVGRVLAIADAVNPASRRIAVRIEVPNADGRLKPQMFASARLESGDQREVAVVPTTALQQSGADTVVFVERVPGRFERRVVTVAAPADGTVEVLTGLQTGERIAVTGTFLLKSAGLGEGAIQ